MTAEQKREEIQKKLAWNALHVQWMEERLNNPRKGDEIFFIPGAPALIASYKKDSEALKKELDTLGE